MGAFSIGGIMPLVPKYEIQDDDCAWSVPEVIAQVDGEDYYPDTTASWGEDALVMVQAPLLRRFSRYWDMEGNSSYHVVEYNLDTQTKTTYTVTPDTTEALNHSDLYAITQLLGEERAKEQFNLQKVTLKTCNGTFDGCHCVPKGDVPEPAKVYTTPPRPADTDIADDDLPF